MSEWAKIPIELVADVFDGPHATPKKVPDGPWYLSISSLSNGRFDLSRSAHLSEKDLPRWTKRVAPRSGDTLFSYETRLGEAAYWEHDLSAALGRRMGLLRPKPGKVEPRYLTYAYLGPQFQELIRQKTLSGATVNRIPVGDMPKWPILLPSLPTQRKILDTIGAIDDLIENSRRRVGILEEITRATYREWFVKFRYPGHEDVPMADSDLGPIPAGWDLVPASTLLKVNPRIRLDKTVDHPFITMSDLDERFLGCRPSEVRSGGSGSKFELGDTLFARITPCLQNGKTGLVQSLSEDEVGMGSTEFIVLRGQRVGSAFTYCLAREDSFRGHAISSMSGASGRQRVRNECFDSYLVAAPPRQLAELFEATVSPLLTQTMALSDESERLGKLRDLLLPKLVSGQIDVSKLDLDELVGVGVAEGSEVA